MTDREHDSILRYLLGAEIPESEQQAIEKRYFEDHEFFDSMESIEDTLIDDYLHGRLSDGDKERFETHYRTAAVRRRRVEFIRILNAAFEERAAGVGPAGVAEVAARLHPFLHAILAKAAQWTDEVFSGMGIPTLSLHAGVARSDEEAAVLTLSSDTRIVRIQALAEVFKTYDDWSVTILDSRGEDVWKQEQTPVYLEHQTATAEVFLPADSLQRGDYVLTFEGRTAASPPESIATYQFAVDHGG
jgi:hypothetical protein